MQLPSYALITPARNEAAFLALTIESVIAQTVRPVKWIIVNDGSTDDTEAIVRKYTANHDWIELLQMPARQQYDFGGKAVSFNTAWARLRSTNADIIGNVDADISFDPDLFQFLLTKFSSNPLLGIAGAPFTEGSGTYNFRFSSIEHVSGACQLFRRECLDAIGGYRPLPSGGIDVLAVLMARMKGWQTRSFPERVCLHHRLMGSSRGGAVRAAFRLGEKDYLLGRHPVWQLFRSIYQMGRSPALIGGTMLLAGYAWSALRRVPRAVPQDAIDFQRREQMQRLKSFLRSNSVSQIPSGVHVG